MGLESGTLTMMLIQLPAAPPPPPPDVAVAAVLAARASAPASAPAYPVLCSVVHDKRSVLDTGVVLLGLARNHDEYGGPAFIIFISTYLPEQLGRTGLIEANIPVIVVLLVGMLIGCGVCLLVECRVWQ